MTQTYCLRATATITGVPDNYREAYVLVPLPDGVHELTLELESQLSPLVDKALGRVIADASLSGAVVEDVTYEAIPTPDTILAVWNGGGV